MKRIIFNKQDIQEIVSRLGKELTNYYNKEDELPPVFIGVMKGALPFMIDLVREVDCKLVTDYVQLSSYMGTETTGVVNLKKDISIDIKNRRVLVIEDIIDSGYTLKWFIKYLENTYQPKEVKICVLLDKKCKRKVDVDIDFVGSEIDDMFIAGYGLDYEEYFRNDPEIFLVTKEMIEEIDNLNKTKES